MTLDAESVGLFGAHLVTQDEERVALGDAYSDLDLVFAGRMGHRCGRTT